MVVSPEDITTNPATTEKVANWPISTCQYEVQRFLGLVSYYRRFINKKDFATIAKPLPISQRKLFVLNGS